MGGSQLGVVLSSVLPETIIILISIGVLSIILPLYGLKCYHVYQEESDYLAGKKTDMSREVDTSRDGLIEGQNNDQVFTDIPFEELPPMDIPYIAVYVVLMFSILYIILDVVENYYAKCSTAYDVAIVIMFPIIAAFTLWASNFLTKQQEINAHLILKGDIEWSTSSYIPVLFSFTVGAISSMCGIGGGELMSPMLLYLGVRADLTTATISLMSLLNTASSTIKYMLLKDIPYGYATLMFFIGAAAGLTGRLFALYVQDEYGRISIMIFAVCCVLLASLVINIYDISVSELSFTVDSFC